MPSDDDKSKKEQYIAHSVMCAAALCTVFAIAGHKDADGATKTLENNGYSEVSITGRAPKSDLCRGFYRTEFAAVAADGTAVSGVVCKKLGQTGAEIALRPNPAPPSP